MYVYLATMGCMVNKHKQMVTTSKTRNLYSNYEEWQKKENLIRRSNSYYFVSNWAPNFHCSHAERIGAMDDDEILGLVVVVVEEMCVDDIVKLLVIEGADDDFELVKVDDDDGLLLVSNG
ncbi:unnamed protein product, partial [Adineta steineri]